MPAVTAWMLVSALLLISTLLHHVSCSSANLQ